ncbi:MAG: type II secretion system F family protein [Acidimicrobiia bacterium]|nr:type II secretion system F family protein [Acidimicrobiia bacterium]MDH3469879.1 type II secretion system F family protein [Acidimicrobiia bacterium]
MRVIAAAAAGLAVLAIVISAPGPKLVDRVGAYLRPLRRVESQAQGAVDIDLVQAGLDWSRSELNLRRAWAAAGGAGVGILLAQGDLFLTGQGRSTPGLGLTGALAGALALNMWITKRREGRARRLSLELPTVVDAVTLHILAGESIATSLDRFTRAARGVGSEELARALATHSEGTGLPEALQGLTRETVLPEASRLYSMLANAHEAGGRLADSLSALAADYRASLERSATTEGGRRALSTYGPILALMIPATLLFLIYPALEGLKQLSVGT